MESIAGKNGGVTTLSYEINHYDVEGLRHELEENGKLVQFLYSDREVVVETEADGNTIRYLRGYTLISSDSESARTYYHYVSDEQGSITHVLGEDEKGLYQVCNRYVYGAFGDYRVCEEQAANRFGYTGQQYDTIAGQYYLRARYYNPVIARFTQEDTYYGAGLNLYAYCGNKPIGYEDPSGHYPCQEKQDLYKKYREQGMTAQDANRMANYELIRKNQGVDAAEAYLRNERSKSGKNSTLALPAPSGTNPWLEGSDIVSMPAPADCYIDMALAPGQNKPGGWGTFDNIPDVDYVRNSLAVAPEFKPEVGYVQRYKIPEGIRIQVGIVGPQTYQGKIYTGGGNQVQILNFNDRAKLIPIGKKRPIY